MSIYLDALTNTLKVVIYLIENIFKKLHIKMKPDRFLTYLFYIITIFLVFLSLTKLLSFFVGNVRMTNNISPYVYSIILLFPVLAYSFYVNSGLAKNDSQKVTAYIITLGMFGLIVGSLACTWINASIWWLLEKLPNYSEVHRLYPDLFIPAYKWNYKR
jgi:hypothetical protein